MQDELTDTPSFKWEQVINKDIIARELIYFLGWVGTMIGETHRGEVRENCGSWSWSKHPSPLSFHLASQGTSMRHFLLF